MQRIIRQSIPGEEKSAKGDSDDLAWGADLIAQAYLRALRQAVPDEPEVPVLWGIPLNRSERILFEHIRRLNEMLCQLARAERWHACEELWDQASNLVRIFTELALKNPEPFKNKARNSLFMPSLRVPPKPVRSRKRSKQKWIDPFLGDSIEVAQAIELSANTIGARISDNRTRLGALCAGLVGECVQEIKRARWMWATYFTPYKRPIRWPTHKQIQPFSELDIDQLIARFEPFTPGKKRSISSYISFFCMQAECGAERLHFLVLKDLTRKEAANWWKNAIEKMIEARFRALLNQPLWARELKAVSSGTTADMRKELKDYCRDKVKQFA